MDYSKFKDEAAVVQELKKLIEKISNAAIADHKKFFVGFSGLLLFDPCFDPV